MRSSRLKVKGQSAVYHCVTRVVGGAMLLDNRAKEVLRKQMWYMARFCGGGNYHLLHHDQPLPRPGAGAGEAAGR